MNTNRIKELNENHSYVVSKQLIATAIGFLMWLSIATGLAGGLQFYIAIFYIIIMLIPLLIPCIFLMKGLYTGDKESYEVAKMTGIAAIPALLLFVFF